MYYEAMDAIDRNLVKRTNGGMLYITDMKNGKSDGKMQHLVSECSVEPLIKDTLNKGHLCIKDTFQCIKHAFLPPKEDNLFDPMCLLLRDSTDCNTNSFDIIFSIYKYCCVFRFSYFD